MEDKQYKTPEYTRRANKNYQSKRDVITLSLEKGIKERIKNKIGDKSINQYCTELILKDLEK